MSGYQRLKMAPNSPLSVRTRVCNNKCAPSLDHCICCFLQNRLLTTSLTVDSTQPVAIASPWCYRSPSCGITCRLFTIDVRNSDNALTNRGTLLLDSGVFTDQQLNERTQQRFASLSDVVHKLEEPQVEREFLL